MTRKIITYIYLFTVLLLSACQKTLNLSPKDQVSDASFWKTSNDFELAANNFYDKLMQVPQYIDCNSDIAFEASTNSVSTEGRSKSNGSYLPVANSQPWDNAYAGIRATNYLLQKARESKLGSDIDRWVGEAFFFRAYNY